MSAYQVSSTSNPQSTSPVFGMSSSKYSGKNFGLVVAAAAVTNGVGANGGLPWRIKADMKFFKKLTSTSPSGTLQRNAVIMGRKTWDSIPAKFRPLPDRINVVLTRSDEAAVREKHGIPEDVVVSPSLEDALCASSKFSDIGNVFVIGGGSVYKEAIEHPKCDRVFLTRVYGKHQVDTYFPSFDESDYAVSCPPFAPSGVQEEGDMQFEFKLFTKKKCDTAPVHEEMQYLDLVREVIEKGVFRGDRTGTGTLSVFGRTMRFSLRDDTLPLLTTKRTFWRGVAEELLWFVSGDTNAKTLQAKKIRIWDGNGSREYLDSIGLTDREEGDLGPVYGFQWRHFGAEYGTCHDDYTGKGVDQLKKVIETLKTKPTDRRMIISAWNPAAFHLMALPPCHMFAQFYVANGELSCQMYQRSADMGLGVPFNIASYSLLTRMIAQVVGLKAGDFVHVIGDCHVYSNHVDPLKEQLLRTPREFPKLKINPDVKDIDGFKYEDFEVVGYKPHKTIKMKMAV